MTRRIYPTRFGQMHLRSNDGKEVPLVPLHMSPRSGAMWELLQERLERPTYAPDRLGYGFSDAPPALGDGPEIPLWFRPEWMGLVQGLHRCRRRRRNARRGLPDPDYSPGSLDSDDSEELP